MIEKLSLSYTDGDFIDHIEIPIYKVYGKGASFQLYHLNRNPARNEHKELLVIDESGITPESMFQSVTEFSEKIIPYLMDRKNDSVFIFGAYYDAEKDQMVDIDDVEISCLIGGSAIPLE